MNALDDLVGKVSRRCLSTQPGPYHNCCNCVGFHRPERGLVVDSVILYLGIEEVKCLWNVMRINEVTLEGTPLLVVVRRRILGRTKSIIQVFDEMTPKRYRFMQAITSITVM